MGPEVRDLDKGNTDSSSVPLRVLIVEDSADDCLLVMHELHRSGFQPEYHRVYTQESMSAALKKGPWDVIITDYSMPRFSALAALELVRKSEIDIPFIVISGTVGEDEAVDTMRRGAHDYLMKDRLTRLGEAVRREIQQARVRAERRMAQAQTEHLIRVLRAIRDVNQLIVREKRRDHLIKQVCETLVRTRGYRSAWIIIPEESPSGFLAAHAALSDDAFSNLVDLFHRGELPLCCRRAQEESGIVCSQHHTGDCNGCPLEEAQAGAVALTAGLVYEGRHYGFLGTYVPTQFANDQEEVSLFKETVDDISFALYTMEADKALQESEQTLRTIFDSATDGILLADAQTRQFVNANRAVCQMLGYTLEELKELSVDDIHPVEHLEHVVSEFEKQLKGEKILAQDIPMKRKDGSVFFADVNSARIELQGREHLLGIFRDITERKQSEQELHETIEELQKTQLQLTQRTRWIQALNSISGEVARRNSLESIMRVVIEYLEDSFPFAFGGISIRREEERESHVGVLSSRGRSLASRLGIEEGERISVGHTILPLDLEVRQARLAKLADIDPADMPQESRLLIQNLKKEGMKEIVVVPLDVEKIRVGAIFMLFKKRVELGENEWGFLNGMAEYVSLSAQNWRLYAELEESYRKLQEAQEAMMRQERLSAMGQMASGIAHDINNVLVPISLYAEALLEGEPGLSDRANRFLTTIQKGVRDIENVTLRLRSFYKKEEEGEFQFLSIEELFDSVIELSRPRWKDIPNQKGIVIQMQKELEKRLPVIIGSESEVREALLNLVFNAVDAMPKGGTITLKGRKQESCVVAEITDTGIGMDQEQKRRCLEPFFTTKGERGSGLGLSSVFGMLQRHNGEMEIESEPGKGTTIRLLFPLGDRKWRETTAIEEPVPLSCLRILCVDDDQRVREALKEMLTLEGHNVTVCASGEKALKLFRTGYAEERGFDLVITDLGMPHMDGKAVAQEIKKASNTTPVILLSGWGNFMNLNGELPENVDCLLGKPPRMSTLRGAISALMSRREK